MLPRLSAVLARIWTDAVAGDLVLNTGADALSRPRRLRHCGSRSASSLGIAMSRNVAVRWLFDPIVSVGFPMPKIAFLPVIMLWLGVYDLSKIAMVVLDAIFPVVTATIAGIAGVERAAPLVGPQHGRQRARARLAGRAAGGVCRRS